VGTLRLTLGASSFRGTSAVPGHASCETFLAELQREDRHLPAHVEGELRRFLDCGIFARGFSRWVCEKCGVERVVASSCKGRGFCPSCIGRRMNETAALLVDHVLPPVPVRQWVLTLPIELRYRLAYDGQLCSDALAVFLRAVSGWYRRRASELGYPGGHTGAVTVIQRANSDLRLAPHFHSLLLDGVHPPLASSLLRWLSEDELLLRLKRPWGDGTSHLLLSPSELLARLAALVPPKGFNLLASARHPSAAGAGWARHPREGSRGATRGRPAASSPRRQAECVERGGGLPALCGGVAAPHQAGACTIISSREPMTGLPLAAPRPTERAPGLVHQGLKPASGASPKSPPI